MGGDSPCSRGGTACTAWSAWLACTSSKAAEVSRDGSIPAGIPPATESTIKYAQHRNEQRSRINNVALKKVRVLQKKKITTGLVLPLRIRIRLDPEFFPRPGYGIICFVSGSWQK